MAEPSDIAFFSAAGNRFALARAVAGDAAALARELAARHGLDGLLLCAPPEAAGDCRMIVFNADGSRAGMCGNGLRCVARYALERGYAPRATRAGEVVVETDAGPRRVWVRREGGEIRSARSELGVPRLLELETRVDVGPSSLCATLVDLGNPHCVLFVRDVERLEIVGLARALEHHPRFPERTNVEFVEPVSGGLRLRVHERGVGETASCGSGAGAAAAAAIRLGRARSPVRVFARGGELEVTWDGSSTLFLEGPVSVLETAASSTT